MVFLSIPGNVDQGDVYLRDRCPAPAHCQVSITGFVGEPHQPAQQYSLRGFELDSSVYDPATRGSQDLSVMCYYPNGKRFERYPIPRHRSMVVVTGAVIGRHEALCCPVVHIQDISFLPQNSGKGGSVASSSAPPTPQRNVFGAWGSGSSPRPKVKKELAVEGESSGTQKGRKRPLETSEKKMGKMK